MNERLKKRFADRTKVFKIVEIGPDDAFKFMEEQLKGKLITDVHTVIDWKDGWLGVCCSSLWNDHSVECFHQVKLRLVRNATCPKS